MSTEPIDSDFYSLKAAAKKLKMRQSDARDWLIEQGLVRWIAGRRRVYWPDVVARRHAADQPSAQAPSQPTPPATHHQLRRVALD